MDYKGHVFDFTTFVLNDLIVHLATLTVACVILALSLFK